MKRLTMVTLAVLAAAAACAQTDVDRVMEGLRSPDAAVRRAAAQEAVGLGAPMTGPLLGLHAEGTSRAESTAERALHAIVAEATRPGNEETRRSVATALSAGALQSSSERARSLAASLLGVIGGQAAAFHLVHLLVAQDAGAPEAALTALERMPGPQGTMALLGAMKWGVPPGMEPRLLLALGARRDAQALGVLMEQAQAAGWTSRSAALTALGMLADPRAAAVLAEGAALPDEGTRKAAVGALIALADAQQQSDGPLARRCYRRACDYAVTPAQKTAALLGLSQTDPANRVTWLLRGLGEEHARGTTWPMLMAMPYGELAGPLTRRLASASDEEAEWLRNLANERGVSAP